MMSMSPTQGMSQHPFAISPTSPTSTRARRSCILASYSSKVATKLAAGPSYAPRKVSSPKDAAQMVTGPRPFHRPDKRRAHGRHFRQELLHLHQWLSLLVQLCQYKYHSTTIRVVEALSRFTPAELQIILIESRPRL
ncbi:hypothetical protein CC86DRAFT_79631 [Ophiobolus disseminans]|uniref:Uncharacterized protein n=1 Tax=Ophiobolus disseminans TaxID=1469910 RepID=A0A6A6ZQC1_9PLEO|nr:hypothetical protein CC86DRAFT_79631 [Ophiobolus disseminans]